MIYANYTLWGNYIWNIREPYNFVIFVSFAKEKDVNNKWGHSKTF